MSQNIIRKRKKRFVAMLMVFAMIIGLMPHMSVKAEEINYYLKGFNDTTGKKILVTPDFEHDEYNYVITENNNVICKLEHGGKLYFNTDGFVMEYYDSSDNKIEGYDTTTKDEGKTYVTIKDYPAGKSYNGWRIVKIVLGSGSISMIKLKAVTEKDKNITYHLPADENIKNNYDNPQYYTVGVGVKKINPPLKRVSEGYPYEEMTATAFLGWYKNASYDGSAITSISTEENTDIELYGLFKGETKNIIYKDVDNTDGAAIGVEGNDAKFVDDAKNPKTYTEGVGTIDLGDATKPHYDFKGWFYNTADVNDPEKVVKRITRDKTGEITLYAKFTPKVYNIEYHLNGGQLETGKNNPTSYTWNTTISSFNAPKKTGYDFVEWNTKPDFSGDKVTAINTTNLDTILNAADGKVHLYSKYTPKTATLTIDDDGATTLHTMEVASSAPTLTYDADMPKFKTLPGKTGYTFLGYYDNDVQYVKAEGTWVNVDGKITDGKWKSEDNLDLKAKWSANSYNIYYDLDDGDNDADNPATYTFGKGVAALKNATKKGYVFEGWYVGGGTTAEIKQNSVPNDQIGDITFKAHFTPKTATLTIDDDGAATPHTMEVVTPTLTLTYDADMPKFKTLPEKIGCTFLGYYANDVQYVTADGKWKNIDGKITDGKWKSEDGLDLKAKWSENSYKIDYELDNGVNDANNPLTYTFGTGVAELKAPTKTGYTFNGWFDAKTGGNEIKKIFNTDAGDKKLYARWTINKYNVTFVDEDGSKVLKAATAYDYGTTASNIVKPDDPTKAATAEYTYTFAGWSPEIADVGIGDAIYTATYTSTKNSYNITWKDGAGNVIKSDVLEYGQTPSYTGAAPTKSSTVDKTYTFNNAWTPEIVDVVGDATYTATFDENVRQYKLTFDGNGATGLNGKEGKSMEDQLCDYNVETPVKANEYIRKGYEFAGWNTQADGKGISYADKAAIKITGDTTLYAQWKLLDYSIKYVTKMGEYFDGTYPDSNPTSYTYGTAIGVGDDAATASKIADVKPNSDNYTFDGWYKDASFTGGKFAGINAEDIGDVTLYAKYIPKKFEIKYIVDGDVKKITGNPETYDYGTGIVKLADFAKDGYNFEGWYTDPAFTKKITAIDPTQSGDIKIYAKVVLKPVEKLEIPTSKTEGDVKGSKFMDLLSGVVKCTKHTIKLSWKKVEGADGYMIYGNQCNHHGHKYKYKFITKVGADTTTWTAKKLKKNKYYKYYIAAYRMVDGKEEIMTISKTVHATTLSKKYGIAQKVKINKNTVNLAVGKTFKLKAKEVNVSRKIQVHRAICFESTDTDIATVNKKGMIKAISSGECKIYVFAQNGKYTTCKIIVE